MKIAIIGSRGVKIDNIGEYLPDGVDEIVSGGAKGVDSCAAEYARANKIPLTEFLPEYSLYGRAAPLKRNDKIAEYADEVVAFWDGASRGTKYTIEAFEKLGKKVRIINISSNNRSL